MNETVVFSVDMEGPEPTTPGAAALDPVDEEDNEDDYEEAFPDDYFEPEAVDPEVAEGSEGANATTVRPRVR